MLIVSISMYISLLTIVVIALIEHLYQQLQHMVIVVNVHHLLIIVNPILSTLSRFDKGAIARTKSPVALVRCWERGFHTDLCSRRVMYFGGSVIIKR